MKTNAQSLIVAIIALACFLPLSEAFADTLVYKGSVLVVGEQVKENYTVFDPPTKERIRKRFRIYLIISTTGPDKAYILIDPKAKTFSIDTTSLTKLPVSFFGVNGKSSARNSITKYVTKNFMTSVDRDSAGGDDTETTKAGSLSGKLREFKVAGIPIFAAKTLRGKYTTTRCSVVVSDGAGGYDPGSEFSTFEERTTLRVNRRLSNEFFFDPVSTATSDLASDLLDDGFSPGASIFADGFESGDTSAWSNGAP